MGLCLQCKKWVNQTKGKKAKKFCNDTCRSNYRYAKNKKEKAVILAISKKEYDAPKLSDNFTNDEVLSFDKLRQEMAIPAATNDFFEQMNNAEDLDELEAIGRKIKSSGMTWREQQRYHEYGKMIAKKKFID